ncbi:valine--tRNA ligase, partial [Candidatus Peregrinibacteria bacterium]|nr:valine--tRNA ligase [Candidatus Peregrinibacteria bacterium]
MKEIAKAYEAAKFEDTIYNKWEKSGSFSLTGKGKPFSIMMPPPNATGTLHLGHATMLALEDTLVRYKRMRGFDTLYLPGTDHAAIATQSVVEKKLQSEGIKNPRLELGREGLLKEIRKFVEVSQVTIKNQIRKMGTSCDWDRERYTFSDEMNVAVNELFRMMYEDGIIYRGGRIVNWDPKMQTTVADDELEYSEEKTNFYYFQYGPVVISTARPETKFMDKVIVVHPDDKRYKKLIGKEFDVEWIEGKVKAKVIADKCIDMNLGTGAMTITPAHSQVDFDIAQKHGLDAPQIIDFEGKILTSVSKKFGGMHIAEAREKIVAQLDKKGLLVKVDENYIHNVAQNYRGKGTIEPQIMKQWFVDVNKKVIEWKGKKLSIKQVLQDTVKSGMIKIIPDNFEKIYFHWIDNLRDWCISRQIWWGHRIPVWYCIGEDHCLLACKTPIFSSKPLKKCPHCGTSKVKQDEDTLDTWFSSQLWTFSTLGWPEKTADLMRFTPSDVLETGYDILFFWVARMILGTTYALRKSGFSEEKSIPFKNVYLHGLIRDINGKKMSKSNPETCIDPLDMIVKYGTDSVRLSLMIGSTPGNDMRLYEEKIAGYRNFVNKIWNGSRFVMMNLDENSKLDPKKFSRSDKWILTELNEIIEKVSKNLDSYQFSEAGNAIYDFFWGTYCDWYVEISKVTKNTAVLRYVLETSLKLMHPFMPFVTEAIWLQLNPKTLLIKETWPEVNKKFNFESESEELERILEVVTAIRSLRAESKVDATKKIHAVIYAHEDLKLVEEKAEIIKRLANLGELEISKNGEKIDKAISTFVKDIEIYLPLADLIDFEVEKNRTEKEMDNLAKFASTLKLKLNNPGFIKNAKPEVINMEKTKLKEAESKIKKL